MAYAKRYYEDLAKTKGFQAVDSVSKELGLLVAADITASSSKLTKAAKLGVKVMALDEFLAMEKSLAGAMKIMLGINPAVHLVAPKTITRSEGKAKRVIDNRKGKI